MVKGSGDYIPALLEYFPEFALSELKEIIDYGLKIYAFANKYQADVTLYKKRGDDKIVIHTGPLGYDTLKHYNRWVTKFKMKERVIWRLLSKEWDGYYYIGVNEELLKDLMRLHSKKKVFKNVYPVKILREIYHNKAYKHVWKVPYPSDCGFSFYAEKLTSQGAEYLGKNKYGKYHQCFLKGVEQ